MENEVETEKETGGRQWVIKGFVDFIGFFVCGPQTETGWLIWGLLFPITFPILAFFQVIFAFLVVICRGVGEGIVSSQFADECDAALGYGGGFFDEVSDRRRADIEFLFGKRY